MAETTAHCSLSTHSWDTLRLIQWQIDRYDRMRASTSSRAAVLLSADAALLAASILEANAFLQASGIAFWVVLLMRTLSVVTIVLTVVSLTFCTNAVAAWRTTRRMHRKEIPSRFMFNWGDTLASVDGYSNFATTVTAQSIDDVHKSAMAELWTAILQHQRRHKHMRYGIHTFRFALISFVAAAVLVIVTR
ncbi:hypothetical protein [Saccharothrix obliqua]|uniref:hypothetical protein n=1 Tax=Saccharothrix obliqua TaxID=2861747 RepID=UPI001C5F5302|nr:hypothetical protein [Saccharothrix obliqua]MBW4721747.1 hypothetical protein [Saccharothrix obliqua]